MQIFSTLVIGPWSNGMNLINFGGQEVKGQGHRRLKIYLEAWKRYLSLGSSIFWFAVNTEHSVDNISIE